LGIGELELDPRGLERILDVLGVGGTPAALRADLGETDDNLVERLVGCPPLALPVAAGVAAPEQAVSASINALAAKTTQLPHYTNLLVRIREWRWIPPDRTAVVGRDIMLRLTC
jgi:hypothetical protein